MEEREAVIAELIDMRERAVGLLHAKLDAIASQIRDNATRLASDVQVVLPPDLEALFPLSDLTRRMESAMTPPPAPVPVVAPLAAGPVITVEAVRRLDGGRAQSEVLQELLRQLDPWCGARAIVVFREDLVTGWTGAGFGGPDPVRGWKGSVKESATFTRCAQGTPVIADTSSDALLSSWLPAGRALAVPMSLRGKVVGALVAILTDAAAAETVQVLTYVTGLLMETLPVRTTVPTAALVDVVDLEPVAPVAATPSFADAFSMPAPAPAMPSTPAVEVHPGPGPAAVAIAEPEPEVDASATMHLKVPVAPVAPARAPEDERRYEEARRFARLLVSEIRLYNEQAVQDGKVTRDIYQRLKEDIDRSREMYEQRVPAEVRASSNYFFEELVRILADGDPDALGL